jgi:predicted house-cleaning noncanonical NTP pyrophosphatase (MazG superfamily)
MGAGDFLLVDPDAVFFEDLIEKNDEDYKEVFHELLKQNVDMNIQDHNGNTLLHLILNQGFLQVIDLQIIITLVGMSANIDIQNSDGETPRGLMESIPEILRNSLQKDSYEIQKELTILKAMGIQMNK